MAKNPVGHQPLYSDPDVFTQKVDEYFTHIQKEKEPATITGLALYLGFCTKQALYDLQAKPNFNLPVKRARTLIERAYEKNLHANANAGSIFALKNMGWKDKTEQDQTVTIKPVTFKIHRPNESD